jgi:hypothetical protein
VPVTEAATVLRRKLPQRSYPKIRPFPWARTQFRLVAAVSELIVLTAPTLPVPTASTKQKHNHDDKQNHFYTHFEAPNA